jgi:hypothetical protein
MATVTETAGMENGSPAVADAAPCDHIVQPYQDQDFSTALSAGSPAQLSRKERASY